MAERTDPLDGGRDPRIQDTSPNVGLDRACSASDQAATGGTRSRPFRRGCGTLLAARFTLREGIHDKNKNLPIE